MKRKKGFTLVELLVAATIIGILAVFATAQYRNGVAETRFTQAKAMTDQLAAAVQRAHIDYPSLSFTSDAMSNPIAMDCNLVPGVREAYPFQLISCGYLERSGWNNEYFNFYVCDQGMPASTCGKTSDLGVRPEACTMVKPGAKLPTKYQGYGYCFFAATGGAEYTGL